MKLTRMLSLSGPHDESGATNHGIVSLDVEKQEKHVAIGNAVVYRVSVRFPSEHCYLKRVFASPNWPIGIESVNERGDGPGTGFFNPGGASGNIAPYSPSEARLSDTYATIGVWLPRDAPEGKDATRFVARNLFIDGTSFRSNDCNWHVADKAPQSRAGYLTDGQPPWRVPIMQLTVRRGERVRGQVNISWTDGQQTYDARLQFGKYGTVGPVERNFMQLAISEARKCRQEQGRTTPSPKVGAVLAGDETLIGSAHRGELKAGEHAEFTLFERKLADQKLVGTTLYTTLEPCSRRGPGKIPCAERIVQRGIGRVFVGAIDPDEGICGKGFLVLEKAGIPVQMFEDEFQQEYQKLDQDFREHRHQAARRS